MVKIRKHNPQPIWRDLPPQKTSKFEIMCRDEWDALPPVKTQTLLLPVLYVRFLVTGTQPCKTNKECIRQVKKLQKDAIEIDKKDDIPYNFLVSPLGHIFVGRGWWREADRGGEFKNLEGNCFDIAYMGNYDPYSKIKAQRQPVEKALIASQLFVEYCVQCKLLVENYKEIPFIDSFVAPPPEPEKEKRLTYSDLED